LIAIDGAASDPTAAAPATAGPRRNFLLLKLVIYFLQVGENNSCYHACGEQINRETIIQLENIFWLVAGYSFIHTCVARVNLNAKEKIYSIFQKAPAIFFSFVVSFS
jgi:hypothetical protein